MAASELTRAKLVFQSLKQLAGFSVPVFYAPEWVMEQKRGWRGRDVCGCVVGGELAAEKGHLQATSSECHLLGLVVVLKGPSERLIDSRLDAACHLPALVFAH